MKFTDYFLNRPVTAIVLNAMIVLVGWFCYQNLTLREYPNVEIPKLAIFAEYPNASADLVESALTNILEDKLAGISGLEKIESTSKQSKAVINVEFQTGISMERAFALVRDAINKAKSQLPIEVREPTVEPKAKSSGPPFMAISVESNQMSFGDLTHFAILNMQNSFRSLQGVASAEVWGQPYTYRVELDPNKMYTFGVNGEDVFRAVKESQNLLTVGKFQNQTPTNLDTTLKTMQDFDDLIIKAKDYSDPTNIKPFVRLQSISQTKFATDDERFRIHVNGSKGITIGIEPSSDANILDVSNLVREQLKQIKASLPDHVKVSVITDQADFVRTSLGNIRSSIIEAIFCVLVIVFLFLRRFDAILIPLVTIPVSLAGGMIFLSAFGFSINTMTLLAMVLAIGLVVDDAIVVLENIARHIEDGLTPLKAAQKGAQEIGLAIVAITLTLISVYAPIAFVSGVIGQIFIEFAVALGGSVLISGLVALSLSPFMCGRFLKPHDDSKPEMLPGVERVLKSMTQSYAQALAWSLERGRLILGGLVLIVVVGGVLLKKLPNQIAPPEDRGIVGLFIQPLAGKDMDYLESRAKEASKLLEDFPEAAGHFMFLGDWGASLVLTLKPLRERSRSSKEILADLQKRAATFKSIDVFAWSWSSGLPGMEDVFESEDISLRVSSVDSYPKMNEHLNNARDKLMESNVFQEVRHDLKLNSLRYDIELNRHVMRNLGIRPEQVAKMVEIFFSGDKSLTFQKDGVIYPISIVGKTAPWTLDSLYVTNPEGKRISIGTFAKLNPSAQPKELKHYNQMRSSTILAERKEGQSFDEGMPLFLKNVKDNLPPEYKLTWGGVAEAMHKSGSTMLLLFGLALVFIFAILAVQFQNFVDPLIILVTAPLCCVGGLFAVWLGGQSMNVYTQVGLITLVGLVSKHGILIVEFANQLREQGHSLREAVQRSATTRLRPILMTTAAMICGTVPLALSYDYGAEARQAIGFVLLGGLTFGTFFSLFVVPMVYVWAHSYTKGQ